jgi:hypothetical protein
LAIAPNVPPAHVVKVGVAVKTEARVVCVAAPVGSGKEDAVIGNVPPAPVTSHAVVFGVLPGCTVHTPDCGAPNAVLLIEPLIGCGVVPVGSVRNGLLAVAVSVPDELIGTLPLHIFVVWQTKANTVFVVPVLSLIV